MVDPVKRLERNQDSSGDRLMRLATYASTGTASLLIATKLGAWFLTDSVAMLSTLIDSMLDLVASLITLYAVRHALVPADRQHRFGHGKAEPLAALTQSGFIAGSAVLLLIEAIERLFNPQPIQATEIGIAVMVLSIAATICLVAFQTYVVRRSRSVAIDADAMHYKADLFANVGVIAALVATGFLGWTLIDPLFGIGVAGYILFGAYNVARSALSMLMDEELPDADRERIKEIALAYSEVLGVHDLRTRRSGPDTFIQMHLDFNGQLTLNRAHAVADAVEKEIMEVFPGTEVLVHEDPVTPEQSTGSPDAAMPGEPGSASDTDSSPEAGSKTRSDRGSKEG